MHGAIQLFITAKELNWTSDDWLVWLLIYSYTLPSVSVSLSDVPSDLSTVKYACTSASVRLRKLDLFLLWPKKPLNNMMEIWHFLQCLLDPNVFPTNTTDLVYEGEESAFFSCPHQFNTTFWPPSSKPPAPTYLLSISNKIFTRRQRLSSELQIASECAVFLLYSIHLTFFRI